MVIELLKERKYSAGYVLKTQRYSGEEAGGGDSFEMTSAYTPEGYYIGSSRDAYRLCRQMGIRPELIDSSSNVCSIGYSKKKRKWYGWGHRAIYGFCVNSKVRRGDCAYVPFDKDDFLDDCIRFWSDEGHENITAAHGEGGDGLKGVWVYWTYSDDIPNKKIRGRVGGVFSPYPDEFGRGEWQAKNMEDAKQMAIDFARGVS